MRSVRIRERFDKVLQLIDQSALPPSSYVLDVGCGAGTYSVALAKRGYVVEAVDAAPAMLERTRLHAAGARLSKRVKTRLGSVYDLAFHDEAFEMVLAIGLIPWLDAPQKAIAELGRVIKPGGFLLITANNDRSLDHLLDPLKSPALSAARQIVKRVFRISWWQWHPAPVDTVYCYRHSVQDVEDLLASAGLTRVHAATVGFGPFTLFDHNFFPNWFNVKAHRVLQYLANLGCPWFCSTGHQLVVLARKRSPHE